MTLSTRINSPLLLTLSVFGLLMGLLSVLGFSQGVEWLFWTIGSLLAIVAILKKAGGRYFGHGLLTGLIWGFLAGLIQSLFFNSYLTNNPIQADALAEIDFMSARYFPLISAPVFGIFVGLLIGGFAVVLYRYGINPKRPFAFNVS